MPPSLRQNEIHNQSDLTVSIDRHMDAVAAAVKWGLLVAIIFMWAGIMREPTIRSEGLTIRREDALFVACFFYIFINLFALEVFLRIGDMLKLSDSASFQVSLSRLMLHSWFANPFAYFGDSLPSKVYSAKGFGLLIVVWWTGNASLYTLTDDLLSNLAISIQGLFLIVGLGSMLAIYRVDNIVLDRLKAIDPTVADQLQKAFTVRRLFSFLGIGLGGLIALIAGVVSDPNQDFQDFLVLFTR